MNTTRIRLLLGLLAGAAAVVVAILAGGWVPIMLGLIAGLVVADAIVPDSHTPLSGNLPESKRRRMRREGISRRPITVVPSRFSDG
jgi:hypothetical protein